MAFDAEQEYILYILHTISVIAQLKTFLLANKKHYQLLFFTFWFGSNSLSHWTTVRPVILNVCDSYRLWSIVDTHAV